MPSDNDAQVSDAHLPVSGGHRTSTSLRSSCFVIRMGWPQLVVAVAMALVILALPNRHSEAEASPPTVSGPHNEVREAAPVTSPDPSHDTALRQGNGEYLTGSLEEPLESSEHQVLSLPQNGVGRREGEGGQEEQREEENHEEATTQRENPTRQENIVSLDGRTGSDDSWRGVRGSSDGVDVAAETTLARDGATASGTVTSEATKTAMAHVTSTALVVAIGGGSEGRAALAMWSDFVLAAQRQTIMTFTKESKQARDCATTVASEGEEHEERDWPAENGKEETKQDPVSPRFPGVWITTSDPWIGKVVRECMPHLLLFSVPRVSGGGGDEDPGTQGDTASWPNVLDRVLSENQAVEVFGIFGEGALPTAALLPFSLQSFSGASNTAAPDVAADGNGCNGGCAIETFLWPVLSTAASSTAVLSRARAWWEGDGAEGVAGHVALGDWMPDRFIAQIWCNRATLETSRRTATGISEPNSMLQVIQRLVRKPDEISVALIDGTKAVPSRYLCPPVAAAGGGENFGKGGSGGAHVYLERISKHAFEKVDRQRELEEAKNPQKSPEQMPAAATSSPTTREPLPEVDFYIGTLKLTLGFNDGIIPLDPENADPAASLAALAPNSSPSNALAGTPSIPTGVGSVMRASWPPAYILENVQHGSPETEIPSSGRDSSRPLLLFPDDVSMSNSGGYREDTLQQGLVIVTSVNCGYLDMATNFLLSVRRTTRNVKVLFVAMDEVAFDFLDAWAPGCTVLFDEEGSKREHSIKAGKWGDDIFMEQTTVRPRILISIMRQGYRLLWTDVDIVWLGNALTVLPVPKENGSAAEVMTPLFGSNKCTCFLYLDRTPNALRLLELWIKNLLENSFRHDQVAFQHPLADMVKEGLRLEILPEKVLPAGNKVFSNNFLKKDYEHYKDTILVVHNNQIVGHSTKRERFRKAGLWQVDDSIFPKC